MNWRYWIATHLDELAWAFDRAMIWIAKRWGGAK